MTEYAVAGAVLALREGDITTIPADAIVNAANARLAGGGGVDGAIHRAGGPAIMRELDAIRDESGGCEPGNAVITSAGDLPAQWVIHTVGPIYENGRSGEPKILASCYRSSLQLAARHQALAVTFPSISTGVYGYPMDAAAAVAITTVHDWLVSSGNTLERAEFVLFGKDAYDIHAAIAERILAR